MCRMLHKVNFYRRTAGLSSKFSFSWTDCHTMVKNPSLPYYLSIAGRRIVRFIIFPRVRCEMWNANSVVHDLNSGRRIQFLQRNVVVVVVVVSTYVCMYFYIHNHTKFWKYSNPYLDSLSRNLVGYRLREYHWLQFSLSDRFKGIVS